MELTPQTLHDVEFRGAVRGYDRDDVDEFLERIAVGVGQLQDRLREALERATAAERKAAEAEARARTESPNANATPTATTDFDETLKRTLVLAQRTADAAIDEARQEATTIVTEARDEVDAMLAGARAEAERITTESREQALRDEETRRTELLEQIAELDTTRSAMQTDIEVLNRHFDEQRERVHAAIGELRRLVDDAGSLQPSSAPELSGAQAPAAAATVGAGAGEGQSVEQPVGEPVGSLDDSGFGGEEPRSSGAFGVETEGRAGGSEAAPAEPRLRPTPIGLPDEARRTLEPAAAPEAAPSSGPDDAGTPPLGSSPERPTEDPDFWKRNDDLTGPNPLLQRTDTEDDDWGRGPGVGGRPRTDTDDADDDGGPPTAPVMRITPASRDTGSEDAFLDELRKASLGHESADTSAGLFDQDNDDAEGAAGQEQDEHARRSRFGRRR